MYITNAGKACAMIGKIANRMSDPMTPKSHINHKLLGLPPLLTYHCHYFKNSFKYQDENIGKNYTYKALWMEIPLKKLFSLETSHMY